MKSRTWSMPHGRRRSNFRLAAVSLAMMGLALASAALSAPAGAASTYRTHGSAGPVVPAGTANANANAKSLGHDAATPLTLATFDVTDLATGDTTVTTTAVVTPSTGCSQNQSFICLTTGVGGFTMTTATPMQAGQTYGDLTGLATVSVNGNSCGEFGTNGPTTTFDVELDQFDWTGQSPPFDAFAAQFDCTNSAYDISGTIAYNIVPTDPGDGYYVFGQQGELAGFGNDNYLVYLDGAVNYNLNAPIVGMAPTPDGAGYWMVGSDGGVYASGDAQFFGSTGSLHLNKPIVGMAATPSGHGYWLVASDGGIFAYGDAQFYGSTGNLHLNKPVVGMAPTPDGKGYWFVASDGGIFSYGDAQFYGSTGSLKLNEPIVGMTPTPDGNGYWFTASDGGVFNYGSAAFEGSLGGTGITDVAGMSLGI